VASTTVKIDTRERILRTTLDLIGHEGIAAVTNRRVADAAGVSLGSLTYHFDSQVDLVRESLMLMVGEEVVRLEGIAADLRRARPGVEQVAVEVEQVVRESHRWIQDLAEFELHLRAARDPELRDASQRCFVAYEEVAAAALEALQVPDAERHARSIVALMYGLGLRRLGTGDEEVSGLAEALLTIIRGAQARPR
jgi:TetR/AcrR family transcriptional regulator, regulator of biofilm formation and stress response